MDPIKTGMAVVLLTVAMVSYSPRRFDRVNAQELPPPIAVAAPKNGRLSVQIVNQTNRVVTYQAIRDTELRSLTPNTTVTLLDLHTPINLVFYYRDVIRDTDRQEGLIYADVTVDQKTGGLAIVLQPTRNPNLDRSVVTVDANGDVQSY